MKWNFFSAVTECPDCEGHGWVWDGKGTGHGNDPDSGVVECDACKATGILDCEVCGLTTPVAGFDCIACETVSNLDAKHLTPKFKAELIEAIGHAFDAAMKGRGDD
jgi:hypothetical protein